MHNGTIMPGIYMAGLMRPHSNINYICRSLVLANINVYTHIHTETVL